jgi:hypothetical protein
MLTVEFRLTLKVLRKPKHVPPASRKENSRLNKIGL